MITFVKSWKIQEYVTYYSVFYALNFSREEIRVSIRAQTISVLLLCVFQTFKVGDGP